MSSNIFNNISPIEYAGPDNKESLAFNWYDAKKKVYGKTMEEHLRFAVCYWHSFNWPGNDIFGEGALPRPWLIKQHSHDNALEKLNAAFEFFTRLGAPYFCFHDVDIAAHGDTVKTLTENVKKISEPIARKMENTNIKLLWGTANLFSHPRYMAGAATNPDPEVFKCAAAQVKCMLETTHQLGGENYVLWGGREGYDSLLNTDIKRELEQYARFLNLVIEHKTKIGFKGQILIEPKPHEPAKHQYDRDVATVVAFLEKYDLQNDIKLNIEANHATMAGSSFEHEVANALALNAFGSIDINRGDPQNAWDTDQFNNDYKEMALVMKHILLDGGFKKGGFNFDAKLRRQSIDVEDLFIGHIGGIDVLARALIIAIKMIEDEFLENFKKERYKKWQQKEGQEILAGKLTLEDLAKGVTNPNPKSGNQELLEKYINDIC
tara:strand:+ start:42396 stop:43700 length:1305 start_codon:yes stop_codon:yes gene_type:complete